MPYIEVKFTTRLVNESQLFPQTPLFLLSSLLFAAPNYNPPLKLNMCTPYCVLHSSFTWGFKGCDLLRDKILWYRCRILPTNLVIIPSILRTMATHSLKCLLWSAGEGWSTRWDAAEELAFLTLQLFFCFVLFWWESYATPPTCTRNLISTLALLFLLTEFMQHGGNKT